ncbi:MAG: hypothetical protein APF81_03100 [Desulfosporosinus sp. BRH_c37]|nr:MAG: hypothetical protein APF81_03100 [Desulfosporosinus sp. BRH_c37]
MRWKGRVYVGRRNRKFEQGCKKTQFSYSPVFSQSYHKDGCGKKIFDGAVIEVDKHFLMTSLDFERENKIDSTDEELEQVLTALKAILD